MADQPRGDDSAELQRLRDQVSTLEGRLAMSVPVDHAVDAPARRARWRSVTATALITLGCLLAPLAVVAVWASDQVSDTGRYVETVAPLADDPAVQTAVTDDITDQVFTYVDVQGITSQALEALGERGLSPAVTAQLQALSGPLESGVRSFVHDRVAGFVASDRFATAWEQANAAAHAQLVNLLEGEDTGALSTANGAVALDIGPFVAQVKQQLVDQGFTIASRIPPVETAFVLVQSDQIGKAQNGYKLLNRLGDWLPVISLVLIGLGVYVAKGHRRALVGAGLGVAAGMLVLGVVLAVVRPLYLDAVPDDALPPDAAAAVFDTLVRFLRQALRAVLVCFLVIAAAAFLTGGSPTALRTRAGLTKGIGRLRGSADSAGLRTGGTGVWVYEHKRALRIGAVVLGAAALTFWGHPTVGVVLGLTVAVLVAVALVEFLAQAPAPPATAGVPSQSAPPEDAPVDGTTAPEPDAVVDLTATEPGAVSGPRRSR